MRVVIAPDSFKGSLTAKQAAQAMAHGILSVHGDAEVELRPMADGGEGTLDAVLAGTGGKRMEAVACDPHGRPCRAYYARLPDGRALVELAQASGLPLVNEAERTPQRALSASTYGTGMVLRHALERGATALSLTLGGSATTDGGYGLLAALGAHYLDSDGFDLSGQNAADLATVASVRISATPLWTRLQEIAIDLACDVINPLSGPTGAAAVYGRQKGLDAAAVALRDTQLLQWSALLCRLAKAAGGPLRGTGTAVVDLPGVGAAGGAALPLLCLSGGTLVPGAKMVADAVGLETAIRSADVVITGEGCSDGQSAQGKVPAYVSALAKAHGVPCLLLSGGLAPGYQALFACGVTAAFAASPSGASTDEIKSNAQTWLTLAAKKMAQLWPEQ